MKKKPYGHLQNAIDDIESWSMDDATQRDEEWKKEGNSDTWPLHQWGIWHNWIPRLQKQWEDGDSKALIKAIASCGQYGLPLPEWCSKAMQEASKKIESLEARTWSDIFPEPHKGRRMHDLRREAATKIPAVKEVLDLRERAEPVEILEALTEVSSRYAVSMEKLREWYYEFLKKFPITEILTEHGRIKYQTGTPPPRDDEALHAFRWQEDETDQN
jgi:hypothetical protein